jgi:hypothetical protein
MSSEATTAPRRPHAARLRRVALTAAAVVVGAIVLSGCVVIQSESATQANVIGTSVTVSTVLCASNAAAAAPCNSGGTSAAFPVSGTSSSGQLLVGYQIPAGVTAPPTITTTVPTTDSSGNAITATLTLTNSASYTAGLVSILPPPAGTQWVGYVSETETYFTSSGPQSATFSPTFGLPAGFTGSFTWRTVVGYRSAAYAAQDVSCPNGFPGTQSIVKGISSVCVDYPDQGTITGAPNALQVADLAITPPATATVAAGGSAALNFAALLTGGNPSAAVFAAAASTTLPGVTAAVTPANFAPAANSQTNLGVSFGVPASTKPGSYDVTVSATVAGISRAATGHITVTAPKAGAAGSASAKLTLAVKKTTLKVARKTGVSLSVTLSKKSAISLVATQTKPKVSVTVKKTLKAGKKTVLLVKSKKFHKGKVTLTFKGGGVTRVTSVTLS